MNCIAVVFSSSFSVPTSSLIKEGDFAVNDAREVRAVAHDPRDAVSATRELGPLARLLRVLLDEDRAFRQLDVANAGAREAADAAPAAEEFLEGDEDHAGFGRVARLRHVSVVPSVALCHSCPSSV